MLKLKKYSEESDFEHLPFKEYIKIIIDILIMFSAGAMLTWSLMTGNIFISIMMTFVLITGIIFIPRIQGLRMSSMYYKGVLEELKTQMEIRNEDELGDTGNT